MAAAQVALRASTRLLRLHSSSRFLCPLLGTLTNSCSSPLWWSCHSRSYKSRAAGAGVAAAAAQLRFDLQTPSCSQVIAVIKLTLTMSRYFVCVCMCVYLALLLLYCCRLDFKWIRVNSFLFFSLWVMSMLRYVRRTY